MQNQATQNEPDGNVDRWVLLRDIGVLQVKLVADGLRDFVLVPVSLIAGAVSLVKGGGRPTSDFYDLLRLGRRSERWINLFGAADKMPPDQTEESAGPASDLDELVARVESFVVEEYQTGGVTRQARERLDDAIDKLRKRVQKQSSGSD